MFTIPIAWAPVLFMEDKYMKEDGNALHGFTSVVWAAILTNAIGGMIVATVMKYAGNILRNFAQASPHPTPSRASLFSHVPRSTLFACIFRMSLALCNLLRPASHTAKSKLQILSGEISTLRLLLPAGVRDRGRWVRLVAFI